MKSAIQILINLREQIRIIQFDILALYIIRRILILINQFFKIFLYFLRIIWLYTILLLLDLFYFFIIKTIFDLYHRQRRIIILLNIRHIIRLIRTIDPLIANFLINLSIRFAILLILATIQMSTQSNPFHFLLQ